MHAIKRYHAPAERLIELESFFSRIRPPYTLPHIRDFNRLYRELYPMLNQEEKLQAERWVDRMIDNVEHQDLAARIFGVV